MAVDLHVHTTASDGTDSPEEVVKRAWRLGLEAIAITDHDVLEGILPAQKEARDKNIDIVPGVELSTVHELGEVHILGYYMDIEDTKLLEYLNMFRRARVERIVKMVNKLIDMGIGISRERVFAIAGSGAVGRPHLAEALLEAGFVSSMGEAFEKFIGSGRPAYVPRFKFSPVEAVKLIVSAKGVPVLAHPGMDCAAVVMGDLVAAGLQGIEVYHPSHDLAQTGIFLEMARVHSLIITGGSDYHGVQNFDRSPLGSVTVSYSAVEQLKERARLNCS
ncbi:PHP domain protein [Desulfofarcimen acetoxidans DSM 771]|uniref:PHP domain protein n=1 Tax=Desulfofarcimen acetoxidans (strain ATCC 49208 / DSM 771 / KCTC 5769 / VKM B-1644 / 5575) TaxID=485916 RepID=C8W3R2_DESAS|nr:PHP domain-containing protein [Desulfofarcimen acetoxidans]ACV63848.1 PHP domain protein [Desulfofarcimen acetoxidans DSM 771]